MTTPSAFKIVSLSTPSAFEANRKAKPRECDTLILPLNTSTTAVVVYGGNAAISSTNLPPLNLAGICKVVLPDYGNQVGIPEQYRIQNVIGLEVGQTVLFINNNTGTVPKYFTFDLITSQNNIQYAPSAPVAIGTIVKLNAPVAGMLGTEILPGVNVTNGGSGYITAPSVGFVGGANYTATAVLTNSVVTKIFMTNYGTGSPTSVTLTPTSGGIGAIAVIVSLQSMSVNGVST